MLNLILMTALTSSAAACPQQVTEHLDDCIDGTSLPRRNSNAVTSHCRNRRSRLSSMTS